MATESQTKTMLTDKPYFVVRMEMDNCIYEVNVNGVPIKQDMYGRSVHAELPVNHWLRTGENEISIYMLTFDEKKPLSEKASCLASLQVRPDDAPPPSNQVISNLSYSGKMAISGNGTELSTPKGTHNSTKNFSLDDKGDVIIDDVTIEPIPGDGGKLIKQKITIPTPFPEWAFFNSDPQPNVEPMNPKEFEQYLSPIYREYEKVYLALQKGNVESIMPMFEERNRELDIAFYYEPGTMESKLRNSFLQAVKAPNLELLTLRTKSVGVHRYDNKRLVRLVRYDNTPAIVFNITDLEMSESYDIVMRQQDGKWIITR